jgi:mannitol/fructose-specific phosphotransferase system IIA component (Ntr-type)
MLITDILPREAVMVPLSVESKQEGIDSLIDLLAEHGHVPDPDEMKRVVWDRENQRSTGIGEGLAIPHGKSTAISRLVMALGITEQPVEFDAIDDKPVRIIALLLSPSDKIADHIQALGRISRLMNEQSFRDIACAATSADELYNEIKCRCE